MRSQYPRAIVGIWMTTSEVLSDTWQGYAANMEASGVATATLEDNFPALELVTDLDELYRTDDILLDDIEFFGYDPVLPGSPAQHTATVNAIVAGAGQKGAAFSRTRFGMIGGTWQPNYFRPYVSVDGVPILNMPSTARKTTSGGALSSQRGIGLPLPFCHTCETHLHSVKNIIVRAPLGQYIPETGMIQHYIVMCRMTFRMK